MAKKTKRWDLRVTPHLDEEATRLAEQVGKSRNQLIESLVATATLWPELFFVCCPKCKEPMFDVREVAIAEGEQELTCSKGHSHLYSFEKEEFISP